jgi:tetratricopeptide (TPR) repeat protein
MLKLNVFPLWTLMSSAVKQELSLSLYYARDKIAHMPEITQKLRAEAVQARRENRLRDARNILRDALTLSRESADELDLAKTLTALGQSERDLGNNDAALANYEEATAIYRKGNDALTLAHTIRHLGDIHRHEHHFDIVEACYREALQLYRDHDNPPPLDLANAVRGYAILRQELGDTVEAKSLWEEARRLYSEVNVEAGVKESSRRIALLAGQETS